MVSGPRKARKGAKGTKLVAGEWRSSALGRRMVSGPRKARKGAKAAKLVPGEWRCVSQMPHLITERPSSVVDAQAKPLISHRAIGKCGHAMLFAGSSASYRESRAALARGGRRAKSRDAFSRDRLSSVAFTPPASRSWSRSQCGSMSPSQGRLRCTRLPPPGRGIRRRAAPCAGRDRRGTCAQRRSVYPARHPG